MVRFPATNLSIEEKVSSLFQPDTLASHQYFRTLRRKDRLEPEEKLMLAVLEDAIFCFQKYLFARDIKGKRLFQEAQDWILEEDKGWPFSFENICEVLGLSPGYVRQGLMRWERKKLRAHARAKSKARSMSRTQSLLSGDGDGYPARL